MANCARLHGTEVLGHCAGLWCQQSPPPVAPRYSQQVALDVRSHGYALFGRSKIKGVGLFDSQDFFPLKLNMCVDSKGDLLSCVTTVILLRW